MRSLSLNKQSVQKNKQPAKGRNTEQLALLGGAPVRKDLFKPSGSFDQDEILSVMEVFKRGEFSRYAGGGAPDLDAVLALKSRDALKYKLPYWNFLGGEMVRRFEADFSEHFNIDYSIAVNSATTGLSVALAACDIGPGDEVITTSMSFTATATSILLFNSIPVFVDVSAETCCMDPDKIEAAITDRTKAILVVHLLGNAADMDRIMRIARKHNLFVIEDCAQAPGTKYKGRYVGTIGDAGVYSFQETKNLMTGEGSMIITNDRRIAKKCRLIRNHGEFAVTEAATDEDLVNIVGGNFRMTELTAALGVAQLKKLDMKNRWRNANAEYVISGLAKIPFFSVSPAPRNCDRIVHLISVDYDEKQAGVPKKTIVAALQKEGIPVSGGYPRLLYQNQVFLRRIAYGKEGCPFTCGFYPNAKSRKYVMGMAPVAEEKLRSKHIWFYHINHPNTLQDMADVVKAFRKVFTNIGVLRKLGEKAISCDYAR